ncbi:MAG: hypothetical protein KAS74_05615 [Methanosarcinales archaeon]|nr:hypothetical protein [Methanosarcinales archaeon]
MMLVRRLGEAGNEYADTAAGNRMIEARFRCECGMNRIVGRSDWHNRNILMKNTRDFSVVS